MNRKQNRKRLRHEILESRQMLAADVGFSAWTDPLDAADVNGDGQVSAVDALVIINHLNRPDSPPLEAMAPPILGGDAMHFDVNGDGQLSAIDSLRVINRLNEVSPVQTGETMLTGQVLSDSSVAATDLIFRNDYARSSSVLSPADRSDTYAFTADRDFVAIDVNSLADESHVEVRVRDEFGVDVAVASELGDRKDFEGFKIPTAPGRQYQIHVELVSERAQSFGYSIDVMQFDLQQWPSVQASSLPGFAWMNDFGPDSQLGSDIHANVASEASLVRTFDQNARLQSNIDTIGDVDWFRVPSISNAVTVGVTGHDNLAVQFEVYDTAMNLLQPTTTISSGGEISSATYFVDRPSEVFVRVTSASDQIGQYDLQVRDTGLGRTPTGSTVPMQLDDQVGNQISDAAELTFSGTVLTFEQRLETTDDVDVFRIPTAAVTNVIASGVAGIQFELLDANGSVVNRSDPIFQGERALDFGRYTVPLEASDEAESFVPVWSASGSVGRYQLTIAIGQELPQSDRETVFDVFAASESPDSQLGNDRHSSELLSATRFMSDTADTVVSNLDSPDDIDTFYVFGISNVATFSVHTHDPMGIEIMLLDRGGNVLQPLTKEVRGNSVGVSFSMPSLKEYVDEIGNPKRTLFVQVSSSNGSTGEYKLIRGIAPDRKVSDEIMGMDEHSGAISEATQLTISPISHDLDSFLDGNDDRDAFEFTASTSQAALTVIRSEQLGMRGAGTVNLYTKNGVLVEPTDVLEAPFKNFVSENIEKTYDLTAGEDYVAVVYNEEASAHGGYRLRIDARGNVLNSLDLTEAETLLIPDEHRSAGPMNVHVAGVEWATVPLNIQIDGVDDVQLFRFTSSDLYAWANAPIGSPAIITDVPLRFRLFNLNDGTDIGDPAIWQERNYLAEGLPSRIDNISRDYLLAVWSPEGAGVFQVDLEIGQREVADDDSVGDTFADAKSLDIRHGDMVYPLTTQSNPNDGLYTRFTSQLNSADDVDVYRIEAVNSITHAGLLWAGGEAFDPSTQPEAANRIVLELFDENGKMIAKRSPNATLINGWTIEGTQFETTVGQTYYLRINQTTPNPISGKVFIA